MSTPRAHLDRIATTLQDAIADRGDGWLTAARIDVPEGGAGWSVEEWEKAIEARLAACGIDQVDIHARFAEVDEPLVQQLAFDGGWSD